jgi:hypothetical protein
MTSRRDEAIDLMERFAQRTGLSSPHPPQRYLWTDAFAVCNFLHLGNVTGEPRFTELALRLIDQVHHVLGRRRPDDRSGGWLSGQADAEGEAHPTRGGLRIGKPLPERQPHEPFDEQLEWERDGQYFHYLTKWMHALDQTARATGQPLFNRWARELAQTAHRAFVHAPRTGRAKRMYWKLSVDLSHPLVTSMGQHDPLDGLITCEQLEATAPGGEPSLSEATADFAAMVDPRALVTGDPLGIGGLLVDAYRIAQLERRDGVAFALLDDLLQAALAGVRHYTTQPELRWPANHRLAFRELGLAIGLAAIDHAGWPASVEIVREHLARYAPLRNQIETFWLAPQNRLSEAWRRHENINDVMLATALEPDGLLSIAPAPSPAVAR